MLNNLDDQNQYDTRTNMSKPTQEQFEAFQKRINKELLNHPVILDNKYCKWFNDAELNLDDARHFGVQFSVFSNLFLIAQIKKMINSVSIDEMRSAKEILANELGVIFNLSNKESAESVENRKANKETEGDPKYVNTEGSVEGGKFRFKAAHFEWLVEFGKPLGLRFNDMGKRKFGTKGTLFFCDELERLYGSENYNTGAAASYAVENWAAAGFWKQLVNGLKNYKDKSMHDLKIHFFTWHDKVEGNHALHTQEELKELYFGENGIQEDEFIIRGNEMLDGVQAFWDDLNQERLSRGRA
ncbi:hypothetical protein BVY03_02410 [bacterium K02(2017)]|nr:hypothetical protein BVY03_02410 [bacterium K02(2017)]